MLSRRLTAHYWLLALALSLAACRHRYPESPPAPGAAGQPTAGAAGQPAAGAAGQPSAGATASEASTAERLAVPAAQVAYPREPANPPLAADRQAPLTAITWNLSWFQDPDEFPANDERAYRFAVEVLAAERADIVALQEICGDTAFERLLSDLPGYSGVRSGYRWRQRIALLWADERWALTAAQGVHGLDDAGRPPLEVRLVNRVHGGELWVIAVHAKAGEEAQSRDIRERFALGLLQHLRTRRAGARALLLGDINDRLSGSISEGKDSPYSSWVDASELVSLTWSLDADTDPTTNADPATDADPAAEPSTLWGETVDHAFATSALVDLSQPVQAEVLRDELLALQPDYLSSVSDHFPVRVSFMPSPVRPAFPP